MEAWDEAIAAVQSVGDADSYVLACEAIDRLAEPGHLPELLRLLVDAEDFAVREAVAVPVARLQGIAALPALLCAYRLNLADGHDNDSLTATVTDLVKSEPAAAAAILAGRFESANEGERVDAAWLWGYLASVVDARLLFNAARDASPDVRAAALGSLPSFNTCEGVVDALIHGLADATPSVRVAALSALRWVGDRRALGAVETLATDADANVRRWVIVTRETLNARSI